MLRRWLSSITIVLISCISVAARQSASAPASGAGSNQAAADINLGFSGERGLVLFTVAGNRASAFAQSMVKLREAMKASGRAPYVQQVEGSSFYLVDAPNDDALYLLMVDKVVPGTDYDPVKAADAVLTQEAARDLLATFASAIKGATKLDLINALTIPLTPAFVSSGPDLTGSSSSGSLSFAATARILEKNEVFWRFAYRIDVSNRGASPFSGMVTIEFQDAAGIAVRDDRAQANVPPGRTETYTGTILIRSSLASGLTRLNVK